MSSEYQFKTGSEQMQAERIHAWLSTRSYWAKGIPFEKVATFIMHSFCIGVFYEDVQVGFARLVTDYSVFAYLADVYIEEAHRGKGLSKEMMATLMDQPWIQGLRRLMLATQDAHGLYAQFGFVSVARPDRLMEIVFANPYIQPDTLHELP